MSSPTAPALPSQRWLYGPLPDLLFGCGLIYCLAFAALAFAGPQVRAAIPFELTPLILLVTGIPHYGATLLRVYQRAEDRRRYALFAIWASLAVWAAFAVGVHQFTVGSVLLTVYLTWSPWHYAGQNYGIAMMFLRRRGITVTEPARRLLHGSFVLSFLLTAVAFHSPHPDVAYAPGDYQRSVYHIIPLGAELGVPYGVVQVVVPLLLAAYLACLLGSALCLRRAAPWRDLGPTALLAGSQALWFSIPMLARHAGVLQGVEPFGTQQATYVFLWIAVAHSVQYVWITSYYARRAEGSSTGHRRYLLQTLLAGSAIWVVPSLLFAPGLLGVVPYDAGLGALVAAAVNIHHFILDGAIWKLRDGRIARILLRPQPHATPAAEPRSRPAAWALGTIGVASVVVLAWSPLEEVRGNEAAQRGDLTGLEAAHDRLSWLGRESALTHAKMAVLFQRTGNEKAGWRHAEAVRRLHADWGALGNLGVFLQGAGRLDEAIATLEQALALRPDSARIQNQLAQLLLAQHGDDVASVTRAVTLAERAVELSDSTIPSYVRTLVVAYGAAGRAADALRSARVGASITDRGSEEARWFDQAMNDYQSPPGQRPK